MNEPSRPKLTTLWLRGVFSRMSRMGHLNASEKRALFWAWLYIFALFVAYYVLRPIRDELGVAGGVRNLPWLFTGTLLAMVALNPLFSYVVGRWTRERFIAMTYRFFMLNLLGFMIALMVATPQQHIWIGRAFFIWVSVFNLFAVSVFWSLVVDTFNSEQGKRLFGILAAGATLGGIAGSGLTTILVKLVGQNWLLLISIALLELAVFASNRLSLMQPLISHPLQGSSSRQRPIGGGIFSGIWHTFRSPYLMGIAVFILCYAVTSTFLYFQQASIAETHFSDRAARTAFFARIDLWVNALTLLFQLFITGKLISRFGVALTLCALPFLSLAGFAALAISPSIGVFVVIQVMRRVANFALAKPAREVLFTAVRQEDRYKAKNFIDTVVYRGGDQVASWVYAGLMALGMGLSGIAMMALPLCAAWIALSLLLGKSQKTRDEKTQ